jgi:hypothetical protein
MRTLLILLACILLAGGIPAQQVLFSDNFDEQREGTRPDVARWLIHGPTSNEYYIKEGGGLTSGDLDKFLPLFTFAFVNTPDSKTWENVRVGADVVVRQDEGAVALALRVKDFNNYYSAVLNVGSVEGNLFRSVEINKWVTGVPLDIEILGGPRKGTSGIPAFEDGKVHRFEFEADGPRLIVYLDGVAILSANDTSPTTSSSTMSPCPLRVRPPGRVVPASTASCSSPA